MGEGFVEILCGTCTAGPKSGIFGAILRFGKAQKEVSFYDARNIAFMEVAGIVLALSQITKPCRVKVVIESKAIRRLIEQRIPAWCESNTLSHTDLGEYQKPVEELIELIQKHHVEWDWRMCAEGIEVARKHLPQAQGISRFFATGDRSGLEGVIDKPSAQEKEAQPGPRDEKKPAQQREKPRGAGSKSPFVLPGQS